MKTLYFKVLTAVFFAGAIFSCSDKKHENNIKGLEKRIAALEGKAGVAPENSEIDESEQSGNDADFAAMTFENTDYDFGSVAEGEIVDYTYNFKNTSNNVLIISKADATCGCTVPEWPKEPIQPGESGSIRVKFDSQNKENLQTKYVSINANTKPEVTRLKLTGNVVPAKDSNN